MAVAYGNLLKLKAADTFSVHQYHLIHGGTAAQRSKAALCLDRQLGEIHGEDGAAEVDNIITETCPWPKRDLRQQDQRIVQRYLEFLENSNFWAKTKIDEIFLKIP